MSAAVGLGMAATGLNGEMPGCGARAAGGTGVLVSGTSIVVACGTVTWGTVACGTNTPAEYGNGLFVTSELVGH